MQRITSLPLDTSTPPPFQEIQCKCPRFDTFRDHHSFFYRPTPGTGIPKGAIAGIVVGVVLGVALLLALAFVLWRHRRRKRRERSFTFIEPSTQKGFDITEVLDIRLGGPGELRKTPTQSSISEVSLDLFPVTISQTSHPRSKPSPPTFPRSPTTPSPPSPTRSLRDADGRGVVHSPEAEDQYLSMLTRSPFPIDFGNTPAPGLNRRSGVPKPAGPRPQSWRASTDDPRTSAFIPPVHAATDPNITKGEELPELSEPPELPEPETQQVNAGDGVTSFSFLDMDPSTGTPSTRDGSRKSQNSIQPISHTNLDSPRHSLITRTNSTQSHRYSDGRQESERSKPLSLSVVIQPPPLKYPPSAEPHPYSPYSKANQSAPQPHRHRSVEGASPTESVPMTTSEFSEIHFRECSEPNASVRESGSFSIHPPPIKVTPISSPIYQKLFGTKQGDVPPDELLAKKRPLHRKALSASMFNTPPRM